MIQNDIPATFLALADFPTCQGGLASAGPQAGRFLRETLFAVEFFSYLISNRSFQILVGCFVPQLVPHTHTSPPTVNHIYLQGTHTHTQHTYQWCTQHTLKHTQHTQHTSWTPYPFASYFLPPSARNPQLAARSPPHAARSPPPPPCRPQPSARSPQPRSPQPVARRPPTADRRPPTADRTPEPADRSPQTAVHNLSVVLHNCRRNFTI